MEVREKIVAWRHWDFERILSWNEHQYLWTGRRHVCFLCFLSSFFYHISLTGSLWSDALTITRFSHHHMQREVNQEETEEDVLDEPMMSSSPAEERHDSTEWTGFTGRVCSDIKYISPCNVFPQVPFLTLLMKDRLLWIQQASQRNPVMSPGGL